MQTLGGIITQLLHLALMLALAPFVVGGIRWLKARMMGRRGASPLQPFRDLAKLLRKRPVLAENASAVSEVAPYVALIATITAAALVPSFAHGMLLGPVSDLVLIAGLLALARVALAIRRRRHCDRGMAGTSAAHRKRVDMSFLAGDAAPGSRGRHYHRCVLS